MATILKDGRYVDTVVPGDMTTDELSSLTVGRDIETNYHVYEEVKKSLSVSDEIELEARGLTAGEYFFDVSFRLRKREILSLVGLEGAGMEEVLECIFDIRRLDAGTLAIRGDRVDIASARQAIAHRIGYIPEEQETQSIINMFSVKTNIVMPIVKLLNTHWLVSAQKEKKVLQRYSGMLRIKAKTIETLCNQLSGGNKQKVLIGKWLASEAEILLLNNPTRGVDVGVKSDIYNLIFELAKNGVSIILVTGELPEAIRLSHRILTMSGGRVTGKFSQRDEMVDEKSLIAQMM